jgi:hypothetical protein
MGDLHWRAGILIRTFIGPSITEVCNSIGRLKAAMRHDFSRWIQAFFVAPS